MRKKQKTMEELLEEALVPEEEQPYEVPGNWVWVKLKTINKDKKRNIDPKSFKDETFELYSVPSFPEGSPEFIKGDEIGSSKQLVNKDEILLCKINPRINRVWKVLNNHGKFRQLASTEWIVISENKAIYSEYLLYLLKSPYFRKLITSNVSGVGGSLTRARPKEVETYPIAVPPIKEQKRIADKVERLLSKIDEAKRLIEEAKETFELRGAAILDKAFRGELTRKWREENKNIEDAESLYVKIKESQSIRRKVSKEINIKDLRYSIPSTWKWVRLGDVFTITSGGTPKRTIPEYYEGNIPWIKTGEIKWNAINESEEQITPEAVANSSAKLLPPNTVLVAMYGQGLTRGRAAILSVEATCNQAVCALLPNDYIAPEFIFYYFMEGYQRFRQVAKGGNQENLSVSLISDFIFPLPPLEEQRVIITTLQNIFKKESKIKDLIKINTDEIKQSILSKAFRGELGTNDPTEESAIELLKEVLQEQVK
ncbi:restriction endonuclease subunit S [Heyndrickxia coagulans]|uniref:restriction endonuclease subunit S n=2 Tax=Heyndrickxia coagulans TaxID=1398 RepID=UPI0004910B50|nr:restriction endonuclease subunit S [Heyndrickxia coagulans]